MKFFSKCVPRYFAVVGHRISLSEISNLFLGICLSFVNIAAVLLSAFIFIFHLHSQASRSDT